MGGEAEAALEQAARRGVRWTTGSMLTTTVAQLTTLAVVGRLLSPVEFGLMGIVTVFMALGQAIADLGTSNAVVQRPDITDEVVSSLFWLNAVAGCLLGLALASLAPSLAVFYAEPGLRHLTYIMSAVFPITALGQQSYLLLQRDLRFRQIGTIEMLGALANLLTAVVMALMGGGVLALGGGVVAGAGVRAALFLSSNAKRWWPRCHFAIREVTQFADFGLYQMGERAANYVSSNIDAVLIGTLLGARPLGLYNMACNLTTKPIMLINPAVTRVAFPVFSRMHHDLPSLRRAYLRVLQLLSLVTVPLMTGMAIVAPRAVPVVLGEQWAGSVRAVQIMAVAAILRSISNPVGALVIAEGKSGSGFQMERGSRRLAVHRSLSRVDLMGSRGRGGSCRDPDGTVLGARILGAGPAARWPLPE